MSNENNTSMVRGFETQWGVIALDLKTCGTPATAFAIPHVSDLGEMMKGWLGKSAVVSAAGFLTSKGIDHTLVLSEKDKEGNGGGAVLGKSWPSGRSANGVFGSMAACIGIVKSGESWVSDTTDGSKVYTGRLLSGVVDDDNNAACVDVIHEEKPVTALFYRAIPGLTHAVNLSAFRKALRRMVHGKLPSHVSRAIKGATRLMLITVKRGKAEALVVEQVIPFTALAGIFAIAGFGSVGKGALLPCLTLLPGRLRDQTARAVNGHKDDGSLANGDGYGEALGTVAETEHDETYLTVIEQSERRHFSRKKWTARRKGTVQGSYLTPRKK